MPTSKRLPLYIAGGAAVSALAVTGGILAANSGGSGGAPAAAASSSVATSNTGLGQILVDGKGRTVYLFEKDTGPATTCTGSCTTYWPPVPANGTVQAKGQASTTEIGSITTPGGGRQLSYAGHPLYYFIGDKKAGDTKGQALDQFGALWYALDAGGNAVTQAASTGTSNYGGGY
jgi:predicted lipoprotein with Yx(FWY)xxD motif